MSRLNHQKIDSKIYQNINLIYAILTITQYWIIEIWIIKIFVKKPFKFLTLIKSCTFGKSKMKSNSIKYQSTIITAPTGVAIAATIITTTTTTTP